MAAPTARRRSAVRRWPAALAALALAARGEDAASKGNETEEQAAEPPVEEAFTWNRTELRYPGVPMTKDKCECLNWKSLYDAGRIWCGEGLEFFNVHKSFGGMTKEELMPYITAPNVSGYQHYEFMCKRLFEKLDTNRCMGFGFFGWDPDDPLSVDQWCYVPFSCQNLNGGTRIRQRPVSWKKCVPGQDERFRDMKPMEIVDYVATLGNLPILGTVLRLSYPALSTGIWFDVKKKFRKREFHRMPAMLTSAMKHNVPIVIDTMPVTQQHYSTKKVIYNGTVLAIICHWADNKDCVQVEDNFEYKHPEL